MDSFNATVPHSKAQRELIKKIAILYTTKYGWDCIENADANDPNPDDLVAFSKALSRVGR
jgi:hypothetical protein